MKASWTHRICAHCWNADNKDRPTNRKDWPESPTDVGGDCCFCGGKTYLGIYTRWNPTLLECAGRHE
jgi:hypothetical protein